MEQFLRVQERSSNWLIAVFLVVVLFHVVCLLTSGNSIPHFTKCVFKPLVWTPRTWDKYHVSAVGMYKARPDRLPSSSWSLFLSFRRSSVVSFPYCPPLRPEMTAPCYWDEMTNMIYIVFDSFFFFRIPEYSTMAYTADINDPFWGQDGQPGPAEILPVDRIDLRVEADLQPATTTTTVVFIQIGSKHAAEPRDCLCRPRSLLQVGLRFSSGVGLVSADAPRFKLTSNDVCNKFLGGPDHPALWPSRPKRGSSLWLKTGLSLIATVLPYKYTRAIIHSGRFLCWTPVQTQPLPNPIPMISQINYLCFGKSAPMLRYYTN